LNCPLHPVRQPVLRVAAEASRRRNSGSLVAAEVLVAPEICEGETKLKNQIW
jgi:hypothetical protein